MSLPLSLLGKVIVTLAASAGVAIPVSQALKSTPVERVKLKDENDLKKSCLIVLQGSAKEEVPSEAENKRKLLACQRDKNPWTTEFYFYDSSSPFNLSKLKKVRSIDTNSGDITEVTLILADDSSTEEQKEVIKDNTRHSRNTWTSLRGIVLKEKTTVDMKGKKMQFEDIGQVKHCDLKEFDQ